MEAQSMWLHGKGEELLLAKESFSAWVRHQNHPESFRIFDPQRFIPKDSSLIGLGGRPGHPYFLKAPRWFLTASSWDQGTGRREIAEKFWEKIELQEWKPNLMSFCHSAQFNENLYHLCYDLESKFLSTKMIKTFWKEVIFLLAKLQLVFKRKSIVWKMWNSVRQRLLFVTLFRV